MYTIDAETDIRLQELKNATGITKASFTRRLVTAMYNIWKGKGAVEVQKELSELELKGLESLKKPLDI